MFISLFKCNPKITLTETCRYIIFVILVTLEVKAVLLWTIYTFHVILIFVYFYIFTNIKIFLNLIIC